MSSSTFSPEPEVGKNNKFNSKYKEIIMNLSAPKNVTFWVAIVLGVLGILGTLVSIPLVSTYSFLLVVIAFVLLALGALLKGF
jgi:hypothetical protein